MTKQVTPRSLPGWAALVVLAVGVQACQAGAFFPQPETPKSPAPTARATFSETSPQPDGEAQPIEHRIGVRLVQSAGQLYDRVTGEAFVPRGANYYHLAPEGDFVVDRTFSPAYFNRAEIDRDFSRMHELGYNVVRTALDLCARDCIADPGGGLRAAFLDNMAEVLRLARQHELYVVLQSIDLPVDSQYESMVEAQCCSSYDGYINTYFLSPVGLRAYREYWQEVIRELIDRGAPLEAVMAYEVRGELFLNDNQPPLSLNSGTVTAANGKSYDLSDPADKQRLVEEGVAYWADQMRAAVLELDPTALVTVGFFAPNSPNVWRGDDPRSVPPLSIFAGSSLDLLAVHLYPGYLSLELLAQNFGLAGIQEKPLLMGEFGAFKFAYDTPAAAASSLQNWQVESCRYGLDGWLHWHWTGENDHEVWTGTEGGEAINQVLAPINRPDPCQPGEFDFIPNNVALGSRVTASQSLPDQVAGNAVDGLPSTSWLSGDGPQQWIEVDLGKPFAIAQVRLAVNQYPEGQTVHQLWVAGPGESLQMAYEFRGHTADGQVLEFAPTTALKDIQYIRIVTTESPSWVSWREIEVIAVGGD